MEQRSVSYRGVRPLLCINTTMTKGEEEKQSSNIVNLLTTSVHSILRKQVLPVNIQRNSMFTDETVVDVENEYEVTDYVYIHKTMENYIISLSSAIRHLIRGLLKEFIPDVTLTGGDDLFLDRTLRQLVTERLVKNEMIWDVQSLVDEYKRVTQLGSHPHDVQYLEGAMHQGLFWQSKKEYFINIPASPSLGNIELKLDIRMIIAPLFYTSFEVDGVNGNYLTFMSRSSMLAGGDIRGFGEVTLKSKVEEVTHADVMVLQHNSLFDMINTYLRESKDEHVNLHPLLGGYTFDDGGDIR